MNGLKVAYNDACRILHGILLFLRWPIMMRVEFFMVCPAITVPDEKVK